MSLLADVAIALAIAAVVLIFVPGLAVAGLIAIGVLVVCGISLLVGRRRAGRGLR